MHQQDLARLQVGLPFQGAVSRRVKRREVGRLGVGHGLGDRYGVGCKRHGIFGIGALADGRGDALTDGDVGDAGT